MINLFKHLLPRARAWRITTDKRLRQFFEGLSGFGQDIVSYVDAVWTSISPSTTSELDRWEDQFNLPDNGLTEVERRDRLDAAWKSVGRQDPRYIQDTLQARGFNVFIHEWWVPGTEPAVGTKGCATPRNPSDFIVGGVFTPLGAESGEAFVACGEPEAECGNSVLSSTAVGYLLVNLAQEEVIAPSSLAGEALMQAGEVGAQAGNGSISGFSQILHAVPSDPDKWAYFLYFGGPVMGDLAVVPASRRAEFEELCLRICPTQQWLGILVTYI